MKILILKPSSLGDVIQALPVLRLLKLHFPDAEIFWWIDSALAPLLEGDPDLAGIVRFERKRWARPQHWPEMFRSIRWLRAQNFDLVIDLQCLARSGAFAWLARGKFLVGLDEVREGARGFYDLAVPRKNFHTHAVDWYLSVLPALGVPVHKNFPWLPERPEIAAEVKRKWPEENSKLKIQNSKLILLQPGARWQNKRWPVEHFAELVRALARKISRRALRHSRRPGRPAARRNHFARRAGALPEFVRRNFAAGNDRVDAPLRFAGHERHRPDARRRRARQAARRAVRPDRTAPHRPLRPARKCFAPRPPLLALPEVGLPF